MKTGLIVDSACDIPHEFSREHGLFILPVTAHIDDQTYTDTHDPKLTQEFYDQGLLQKGHHAETEAFSAAQIHKLFMEQIVDNYDLAICETVTRSRSKIYENASVAMNTVLAEYRRQRNAAGETGNFSMRVVDSKQIFAGQGLLAAHTTRLMQQNLDKNALRHEIEAFTDKIYSVVIPRDLHYIRERARRRGDNSVSGLVAFLGKALNITPVIFGKGAEGKPATKTRGFEPAVEKVMNYAVARVEAGLLTPYVSLSCGMSWDEIEALPGLQRLRDACKAHGVELLLSQMGITSTIYIGPGSLCLALAAEPHAFSDFQ